MKYMRPSETDPEGFDDDPMASVGNLFDIALVFAVALLFALMAAFGSGALEPGATRMKADASGKVEIPVRDGKALKAVKQSSERAEGRGVRLGTAYRLEDGTMIYIPEED